MRHQRNNRLIAKRNLKICARYYYWTEEQRLRSDDAIRQLSEEEFFLSEATILSILRKAQYTAAAELRPHVEFKRPVKLPTITKEMLNAIQKRVNH